MSVRSRSSEGGLYGQRTATEDSVGVVGLLFSYKPGTIARSMVGGPATRFEAKGQSCIVRPYRKDILAKGEEKIRFDVLSEDDQTYMESCYAFVSTALAAELHQPLVPSPNVGDVLHPTVASKGHGKGKVPRCGGNERVSPTPLITI